VMLESSIFSQMLQLFSRTEFERAVVEHRAGRQARGFTCWGQFIAMLFCHLGRAQSLAEICGGLAASQGKLRHLGLLDAPKRSTLAYASLGRCPTLEPSNWRFPGESNLDSRNANLNLQIATEAPQSFDFFDITPHF
jgi:hypothetical protein